MKTILNKVTVSPFNIHIEDSFMISTSNEMKTIIETLRRGYTDNEVLLNRTTGSLIAEWTVHNILYECGLFKSHTKDVDLNYPLPWYEKLVYKITEWVI